MKVKVAICPKCGDKIYSRSKHDFRTCSCGETFIDGGFDYIRTNSSEIKLINIKYTKEELFKDYNNEINKLGIIKSKKRLKEVNVLDLPMVSLKENPNNTPIEIIPKINKTDKIKREKFHCPVCNKIGSILQEEVTLGFNSRSRGYIYKSLDKTFVDKQLYSCPNCHLIFWENLRINDE